MKDLMIKTGLLLALCLSFSLAGKAQQSFRFSQFFQNAVTFNPAVTGTEEFLDLKIGYRQQWSGLDDAPQSYFISAHAPLGKRDQSYNFQNNSLRVSDPGIYDRLEENASLSQNRISHGIGGFVVNDVQGIFQQTNAFLNYALHYKIGRTVVGLGLGAGLVNRELDMEGVTVGNTEVPDEVYQAYLAQEGMVMNLDFNAGIFVKNEKFYLGYSANRLMQNELFASIQEINAEETMEHFGMFGLRFNVNNTLLISPGAFVKYVENEPLIYDINLRMKYRDLVWIGASYRNTQTVVAMAGVNISNFINLGYSFDLGLADVNDFTSGIHEIGLGLMLFNEKDTTPYMW